MTNDLRKLFGEVGEGAMGMFKERGCQMVLQSEGILGDGSFTKSYTQCLRVMLLRGNEVRNASSRGSEYTGKYTNRNEDRVMEVLLNILETDLKAMRGLKKKDTEREEEKTKKCSLSAASLVDDLRETERLVYRRAFEKLEQERGKSLRRENKKKSKTKKQKQKIMKT